MADTQIATLIAAINNNKVRIRNRLHDWEIDGMSPEELANLESIADAVENITYLFPQTVEITEGSSYTIPAGYHNGRGQVVVKILDADGDGEHDSYKLASLENITPTTTSQTFSIPEGYYGFKAFKVKAIPSNYKDTTGVTQTATSDKVLAGEMVIGRNDQGEIILIAGSMQNHSSENNLEITPLDYASQTVYGDNIYDITLVEGYYNENAVRVFATTCAPEFNPAGQTIEATDKFFDKVVIPKVPDTGITKDKVVYGQKYYNNGAEQVGEMAEIEGKTTLISQTDHSKDSENRRLTPIPEGYHDGTGKIGIKVETKEIDPKDYQFATTDTHLGSSDPTAYIETVVLKPIKSEDFLFGWTTVTGDEIPTKEDILEGHKAYVNGNQITGTMPDNSENDISINGMIQTSVPIDKGYYDGTSTVNLTSSIEDELRKI